MFHPEWWQNAKYSMEAFFFLFFLNISDFTNQIFVMSSPQIFLAFCFIFINLFFNGTYQHVKHQYTEPKGPTHIFCDGGIGLTEAHNFIPKIIPIHNMHKYISLQKIMKGQELVVTM